MPVPLPTTRAFFYEVVIPGILGAILAYPFLPPWARPESSNFAFLAFLGLSVMIGILPRLLTTRLAFFWLGIYWIPAIRERAVRNLQRSVVQQTALIMKQDLDIWSRLRAENFLENFIEVEGVRLVLFPTVLGNSLLAFIIRFYKFLTKGALQRPEQLTAEEFKRLIMKAYYSIPEDARSDIGESIGLGSGLVNLSVLCVVIAAIYLIDIVLGSSHSERGLVWILISIVVARASHLLGREQLQSSFGIVGSILEDQIPPRDRPE